LSEEEDEIKNENKEDENELKFIRKIKSHLLNKLNDISKLISDNKSIEDYMIFNSEMLEIIKILHILIKFGIFNVTDGITI
jgi:hypothetical protein